MTQMSVLKHGPQPQQLTLENMMMILNDAWKLQWNSGCLENGNILKITINNDFSPNISISTSISIFNLVFPNMPDFIFITIVVFFNDPAIGFKKF